MIQDQSAAKSIATHSVANQLPGEHRLSTQVLNFDQLSTLA